MQLLNIAHNTWEQCSETSDSLLVVLDSCSVVFTLFDSTVTNLRTEIHLYQRSVTDRDMVITNQQQIIKDQGRTIRRLKVHKGILAVMDGILIGIIGYILIF